MRHAPSLVLVTLGALAVGIGLAAAMRQASPTVIPGTAPSDPPVALAIAAGPAGGSAALVTPAGSTGAAAAVTAPPAPTSGPSAQAPLSVPAGAARRIALDPVTGERTEAAWASPAMPLPALASGSVSEPVMRYHADGSVSTRVPEELLPQLVARVGSDGRVVVECVHSGYRHDAATPHQPPPVPAAPEEE